MTEIKKITLCPKCKSENSFVITFKDEGWVKYCTSKGCDYEEKIPTDSWREEI